MEFDFSSVSSKGKIFLGHANFRQSRCGFYLMCVYSKFFGEIGIGEVIFEIRVIEK